MANTTAYMLAGYAVIFVGLAGYLFSLALRWRNLKQDEQALEEQKG